eukprot:TRINITY_DN8663_c0_g1_i1.p1 TRINITY_DN8663_c0_g1~~TRINITY_DN8663_c0_g1_i1.p1  ORF type:complete len:519 (-),score=53.48 TRINITY_DN8663_c0_g1_i1:67-1623(-)
MSLLGQGLSMFSSKRKGVTLVVVVAFALVLLLSFFSSAPKGSNKAPTKQLGVRNDAHRDTGSDDRERTRERARPSVRCKKNAFGPRCESNLFSETEYLPSSPETATNPRFDDTESKAFQEELFRLQNPSSCKGEHVLGLSEKFSWGFGSGISSYLVTAFLHARMYGQVFTANPKHAQFNYARGDAKNCPEQSYNCFFKEFSTCDHTDDSEFASIDFVNQNQHNSFDPWGMPEKYAHRGYFWYRLQILNYIYRPNAFSQRGIDDRIASIASKSGVTLDWLQENKWIGVHIRHGDHCFMTERKKTRCFTVEEYMVRIDEVAEKYGIKAIYLSTDDGHLIEMCKSKYPQYKWLYRYADRSFYDPNGGKNAAKVGKNEEYRLDNLTRDDFANGGVDGIFSNDIVSGVWEGLNVMADVEMMARSYALVGTFSSSMSRLFFFRMISRSGYVPPFISMDQACCWTFKSTYCMCKWEAIPFEDPFQISWDPAQRQPWSGARLRNSQISKINHSKCHGGAQAKMPPS